MGMTFGWVRVGYAGSWGWRSSVEEEGMMR